MRTKSRHNGMHRPLIWSQSLSVTMYTTYLDGAFQGWNWGLLAQKVCARATQGTRYQVHSFCAPRQWNLKPSTGPHTDGAHLHSITLPTLTPPYPRAERRDAQDTTKHLPVASGDLKADGMILTVVRQCRVPLAARARVLALVDKGPRPYFTDDMTPPCYDDGIRVEQFQRALSFFLSSKVSGRQK